MAETSKALVWDKIGERFYETGVKNVALYVYDTTTKKYGKGVAWNGVTAITESPSGAESNPLYADDIKYLNLISKEDFGATIEAYTYPDEFAQCDGSATLGEIAGLTIGQQGRATFGLAYITTEGNDTSNTDYGEKIHMIYGCTAAPSERAYASMNESPEAITFSWEISTIPVDVSGKKPTSIVTADSVKLGEAKTAALKKILFGDTATDPELPLPDALITKLSAVSGT